MFKVGDKVHTIAPTWNPGVTIRHGVVIRVRQDGISQSVEMELPDGSFYSTLSFNLALDALKLAGPWLGNGNGRNS